MSDDAAPLSRVVNNALVPVAGTYEIDPVHTFVSFRAQHLVVGSVRGRFEGVSGSIVVADDPLASALDVTIEASSLTTLHPGRDADLRSSRFLDVASHATLTYRSTAISPLPGGRWLVDGVLAVRGVSRPTALVVDVGGAVLDSTGTPRVAFHAVATLTRLDFGLTTELAKEAGTDLAARDVAIDIDVEAVRASSD